MSSLSLAVFIAIVPLLMSTVEANSLSGRWRPGRPLKRYASVALPSISLRPGRPLKRAVNDDDLDALDAAYLNVLHTTPWFRPSPHYPFDDEINEYLKNQINEQMNINDVQLFH